MFDRIQKVTFIEERYGSASNSTRKFVSSVMTAIYPYEVSWGTDFSEQPAEVLQKAVNEIISMRQQSAEHVLTVLREYVKWRQEIVPSTGSGIFDVYVDTANKMRERMVSSPLHLQRILDDVFDDPDDNSSDCLYRAFLWFAFSGLSAEDAMCITRDDVNFQLMEIIYNGAHYPIYRESIQVIQKLCVLEDFTDHKVVGGKTVCKVAPRTPGNELMRCLANSRNRSPQDAIRVTIRPRLARKFSDAQKRNEERPASERCNLNYDISFDRVYLSGVFYRMYEEERAGSNPDFSAQAEIEMRNRKSRGKTYKESLHNNERKVLLRITRELTADYEAWKKAFSI